MSGKRAVEKGRLFGYELKQLRLRYGLTQEQLAKELGVGATFISKIENGRANPPRDFVDRLVRSRSLKISVDEQMALLNLMPEKSLPASDKGLPPPLDYIRLSEATQLLQRIVFHALSPRIIRQLITDYSEKLAMAYYLATALDSIATRDRPTPVILDSGTTMAYIAYAISTTGSLVSHLEFYTGNLLATLYLLQRSRVYLLGGKLDSEFGACLGSETIDQLQRLIKDLRNRPSQQPLGLLASVAFSPQQGPFARATNLALTPTLPTQKEIISRARSSLHMQFKEVLLTSAPFLILPVNSEKLLRPQLPMWRGVIAPLAQVWQDRIQQPGIFTHVILALPEYDLERQRVVLTALSKLCQTGNPPFQIVQTLFGHGEEVQGTNYVTVVNSQRFTPLSKEELTALQQGLSSQQPEASCS